MRVGVNPIKNSKATLSQKPHRVIIPIYIPDIQQEYYKHAIEILKKCLDSLLATTNSDCTNITLINNGSCQEVNSLLSSFYDNNLIDRYIIQSNRGKVEAVLKEAKASYEEFVTISDADVLFREGWLEESLDVFNTFVHAGTVSPLPTPNIYAYCNTPAIVENFIFKNIKYDAICTLDDLKEFEISIGSSALYKSFYKKQLFIEKEGTKAMLGSAHFVATYKKTLFDQANDKVPYLFENGLEKEYLDVLAERLGLWRLSTAKAYVYHMGDSLSNENISTVKSKLLTEDFYFLEEERLKWIWNSKVIEIIGKIIIRFIKNRIKNV